MAGSRDADAQAPRPDGIDDLGLVVAAQDEAAAGAVLFHGPAEGRLGLPAELVDLDQHDDLVVHLVLAPAGRLGRAVLPATDGRGGTRYVPVGGHLLDDLLDDVAVVDAGVSRADLDVVVGADHVDLDGPLGRGGEGALVEAEALRSRPVDLPEEGHDPRLLPGPGRAVEQEVGEGVRVGRQGLEAGGRLRVVRQLLELGRPVLVYPKHDVGGNFLFMFHCMVYVLGLEEYSSSGWLQRRWYRDDGTMRWDRQPKWRARQIRQLFSQTRAGPLGRLSRAVSLIQKKGRKIARADPPQQHAHK